MKIYWAYKYDKDKVTIDMDLNMAYSVMEVVKGGILDAIGEHEELTADEWEDVSDLVRQAQKLAEIIEEMEKEQMHDAQTGENDAKANAPLDTTTITEEEAKVNDDL